VVESDRRCVLEADFAVDLVADVDRVVLAVVSDAPGSQQPAPTRDAVAPQRSVEDELLT